MRYAPLTACAAALLLSQPSPISAQQPSSAPVRFDAAGAWTAFDRLLRENYGYRDRPGIDGDAILTAFAERARAAKTDKDFIDVLQLVARNFADPHFVVGPLDADDWSVVPTASDLFGVVDGARFMIEDVRADGDAAAKGLRPDMAVVRIDGQSPRRAIEEVTGRAFTDLSAPQIAFAFNVALAGHRGRRRMVEVTDGGRRRRFELAATNDLADRIAGGPLLKVARRDSLGIIRINNSLGDQALIDQFGRALDTLSDTSALLIDLRDTPSGGNTSVARGIMGHFVDHELPYQKHVVPYEARVLGPTRTFMEYVAPFGRRYSGKVYVAGGHWTGSMGRG